MKLNKEDNANPQDFHNSHKFQDVKALSPVGIRARKASEMVNLGRDKTG
jgi:hypothetical protein